MNPTRLARVLMAAAGGLILAGFLSLTVAPAALGLGLLVYLLHTRRAFQERVAASHLVLERSIVDRVVHAQQAFQVELDATGSRIPSDLRLTLTDEVPEGLEATTEATLTGPFRETYTVQAHTKGQHRFPQAHAHLADVRGLWEHTTTVPTTTDLRVLPPREALEAGRRLAKEQPLDATTKKALGTMIRELEFDQLREHQPGDSLRALDWKRFSRLDEMITKVWEKEGESEILLLVDAGRSMRATSGQDQATTKLDHAANLALSLAESAIDLNYPVGLIAFDELRVIDHLAPTRHRALPDRLADHLTDLPRQVLARRRLDVGLPGDAPADDQELDFLATLASLTGRPGAASRATPATDHGPHPAGSTQQDDRGTRDQSQARGQGRAAGRGGSREMGLRRAIGRILQRTGRDTVFVLLFTDLERVPDATLKAVAQLTERGHRVFTLILPGTSFLSPPDTIRARDLENAYKELETRRRAARILAARGVTTLELGQQSSAADITAASRQRDPGQRGRGRGQGGVRGGASPSRAGDPADTTEGRDDSGDSGATEDTGGQGGGR